jgi:hypothetical protein
LAFEAVLLVVLEERAVEAVLARLRVATIWPPVVEPYCAS